MNNKVVHSDPKIMHGTPVFCGTRVPAESLWNYLEAGHSLEGFLDNFPTVKREQAVWLIQQARKRLSVPTIRPVQVKEDDASAGIAQPVE